MSINISKIIYTWFQDASILKICLTVATAVAACWTAEVFAIVHFVDNKEVLPQVIITALGATAALASLIVAAIGVLVSSRRQRRHETVKAYAAWSEGTMDKFKCLTSHLDSKVPLDSERVKWILTPNSAPEGTLSDLLKSNSVEEALEIGRSIRYILNGLERLAVGTYEGFYDQSTLKQLAGSLIVKIYDRNKEYVEAVQHGAYTGKPASRTYETLQWLAEDFRRQFELEKRIAEGRERRVSSRRS